MQQNEKLKRMTTEPVSKLICRMAVPTIISMMISAIYNMADTYFVGQLHNVSATGAVGVVFSFMAVIQAVGFFFGHGSGNYISRELGAARTENAEKMASTGFFFSLGIGAVIAVLGLIFREWIVTVLQATDTIKPYAIEYLTYILIAAPFMCGALTMNNQLRFQGSAFYGMIGMTSGGVLNIGLDWLMIRVLDLGVGGAAMATMVSQMVSFVVLYVMAWKSDAVKIRLKCFTPKFKYLKEIFRGGVPSLCRQGIGSVATICLTAGAALVGAKTGTGDAAITAMTVVTKVMNFASSAMIGFGQGFQPVCGFNYGAGKYDRVRKAFWFCVRTSAIVLAVFSLIGIFAAGPLIGGIQNDEDVIAFGTKAMIFQCITFFLNSWIVISNMMQQTMGKAFRASLMAISRQGLTFIPLVLILPRVMGTLGLQLAQPLADVMTFLISIPLQISILKELKKAENPQS